MDTFVPDLWLGNRVLPDIRQPDNMVPCQNFARSDQVVEYCGIIISWFMETFAQDLLRSGNRFLPVIRQKNYPVPVRHFISSDKNFEECGIIIPGFMDTFAPDLWQAIGYFRLSGLPVAVWQFVITNKSLGRLRHYNSSAYEY